MTTHSLRHRAPVSRLSASPLLTGRYSRMFPDLPAHDCSIEALQALGGACGAMDAAAVPPGERAILDNPRIPSGFTYLGQFIAHDITADHSLLRQHTHLEEMHNIRTPSFDLDCVYAAGPLGSPYLYDLHGPDTFLLGINAARRPDDLPRNTQGVALVGDPRNDVHLIISQLHLALLKFHNRVVAWLREQGVRHDATFSEARRLVTWHYQWIVVHEYLTLTVGQELVDDILSNGPRYYTLDGHAQPAIPVEFADGAFRFGHSQIRPSYRVNEREGGRMFPDLLGGRPVPPERVIDWRYFFRLDPDRPPEPGKRIDSRIAHPLIELPTSIAGVAGIPGHESLATRDLVRARALDLPSGEAIARLLEVEPLTDAELGLRWLGWSGETPLWYYVLREAEVRHAGERLGAVGGRIVAEVLLGLLLSDPAAYLRAAPEWVPTLPSVEPGSFTMADLLRFAGVA